MTPFGGARTATTGAARITGAVSGTRTGGWGGGFSGYDVQKILVGTLIVDMIDPRTEKVVLRGRAEDTVSSKARKNERKAYEAVAEIFEESPWGKDFDDD